MMTSLRPDIDATTARLLNIGIFSRYLLLHMQALSILAAE